jgi:hypothetical protein
MNIPEDVINHITTDKLKEKFVYHPEWFTAAVLTQTYTYMIENGLEYSKFGYWKTMFSFWLRRMRHIRLTITSQNLGHLALSHRCQNLSFCLLSPPWSEC